MKFVLVFALLASSSWSLSPYCTLKAGGDSDSEVLADWQGILGNNPVYAPYLVTNFATVNMSGQNQPVRPGVQQSDWASFGPSNDDLEQLALLHKTLYAEILVGPSARQEITGERIPFTAIPYVLPTPRSQP